MIRLDLKREPYWLELGQGARLLVQPYGTSIMMAAQSRLSQEGIESEAVTLFDLERAMAHVAVRDWSGVGDLEGVVLSFSEAGLDALLEKPWAWGAWRDKYCRPNAELEREKNASAPSLNGTSAAALATATDAPASAQSAPDA